MKNIIAATGLVLAGLLGSQSVEAAPVTLTFEGFADGTVINNQYSGVTITGNSNYNGTGTVDWATVYDTSTQGGRDGDLEPHNGEFLNTGVGAPTLTPGNVLIVQEVHHGGTIGCGTGICSNPDDDWAGGVIRMVFDQTVEFLGFDYFDIEFPGSPQDEWLAVSLFEDLGPTSTALALPDNGGTGGDHTGRRFEYLPGQGAQVRAIEFAFRSSGAIDNVVFNISEVPLPGAIPLFLTGLAGFAYLRKRKQA